MAGLDAKTELRFLHGMGPRRAEALEAIGVSTIGDLLYHFPTRYEDRRTLARIADMRPDSAEATFQVRVDSSRLIRTRRRGFTIFEAWLSDASGRIKGVWYNQGYLARVLTAGREVVLYGRAGTDRSGKTILDNPEYEFVDEEDAAGIHSGRIVPVYRKLGPLAPRFLRRVMFEAVRDLSPEALPSVIPDAVRDRLGLPERATALREIHFPPGAVELDTLQQHRTPAQVGLAFEETFLLQLALALRRAGVRRQGRGIEYRITDALRTRLAQILPFQLTAAQKRVLREIGEDLRASSPMNRLLQGDVGSGKTIVALLTLLVAIDNGYQTALMAPTEILADQHDRNIRSLLAAGGIDCRVQLLTGSLRAAERRRAMAEIADGTARLVIGTHALFERGVEFDRLGLVVVDEQHRFGVLQRQALVRKGRRPDVLVMTATPIPRSMSLTLYGDLDLSIIDQLPPGRTPVRTVVRGENDRDRVWDGLRQAVTRGRQVYVVVPLVEETARSDLKAAREFTEHLRTTVFPDLRVGILHGRMKTQEKDATMQSFVSGDVDVLVATTVIEVGVDVPNATVMIIEHAERFGLSQLHQLRGRVGRGSDRSYCVLMVGEGGHGAEARERLRTMERTTDGFEIAQTDLDLRGPGAVFGTQQHGLGDLQFLAIVLCSPETVAAARAAAWEFVAASDGENRARALLGSMGARWARRLELASVG